MKTIKIIMLMLLFVGSKMCYGQQKQTIASCKINDLHGSLMLYARTDSLGETASLAIYINSDSSNYPLTYRVYDNENLELLKITGVQTPRDEKAQMGIFPSGKYIITVNGQNGCSDNKFITIGNSPNQAYWDN